ncbi:M20 family metallopeptidase [Pantoea sp.]|uniref:M20 family metallopeptidase n=1 Tax=Pantoea sp. TaxID=69393 RepID=UPI00289E9BF0|nr:M20 family metallopeptidase [Pantoea sp.]
MPASLELAQRLLSFDTINPPGNEAACMQFLADWLSEQGFDVSLSSFGAGRMNLIARLQGQADGKPLGFTGHLDTVPLGNQPWRRNPFGAEIEGDRLYGRGVTLIVTGGEETGCDGAQALIEAGAVPEVGALIVGEPTANYPVIGHKGALWLRCETRGKTAHGAMPESGINAIYLAADALGKIRHFSPGAAHPLMKHPTLNVGRIQGGLNINSVPDRTTFDVDIRSVPDLRHATLRQQLADLLGETVTIATLVDLPAVFSAESDPWIQSVYQHCQMLFATPLEARIVPYFTDASVLLPALGHPPCIILGPGEPGMAHQTDEYCLLSRLGEAEHLYARIVQSWS